MNAANDLLIIGTSGLAKECAQLARQIDPDSQRWRSIEYVAESADELGKILPFGEVKWVDHDVITRQEECDVVIGVGHPRVKGLIAKNLINNHALRFPNLIHPSVQLDGNFVKMGFGNVVTKGVVMTCDIFIGNFNLFNWNVTVGHDVNIGSFNVINPSSNVSGHVRVGNECLVRGVKYLKN